ncbi:response regulator [Spirosoma profusum]|uniref:response regulator n=1 Tax=Spirosoma profusum TaxID=2771354 RepID=UPI00293BC91C|nr:response regulator [Spirosoma profusum]
MLNPIHFFVTGQQVLDYLLTTSEQPFLILCGINMPKMNGLELRQRIEANQTLKQRAIPFIFLTTDASPSLIEEAYEGTIQGFFKKSVGHEAAKEQLRWIMGYWQHCLYPYSGPQPKQ